MSVSEKKSILGVLIDDANLETATQIIIEAARQRSPLAISAMAVHGVMEGVLDSVHRYRLNHLDLAVADGQPVRWALNHLHSTGLRQRVYGPNLTLSVLARAEREEMAVYFYGSTQDVLDLLCRNIQKKFPKLKIAGASPSTFGRITSPAADRSRSDHPVRCADCFCRPGLPQAGSLGL